KHPRDALQELGDLPVKELELASFQGEPLYLATAGRGETRIVPMHSPPVAALGTDRIVAAVKAAPGAGQSAALQVLDDYDAYYLDRRRARPLPVVLVQLHDDNRTRYYIDPKTGRIAGTYGARGWISRWLYHGLHSFDFPWLYRYRPLWDIVVISLLA